MFLKFFVAFVFATFGQTEVRSLELPMYPTTCLEGMSNTTATVICRNVMAAHNMSSGVFLDWTPLSGLMYYFKCEGNETSIRECFYPLQCPAGNSTIMCSDEPSPPGPVQTTTPTQNMNKNFSCGMSNTKRIIGGVDALKHEFPWQVLLKVFRGNDTYTCGGIVISDQDILTAAHCAYNSSDFVVILGGSLDNGYLENGTTVLRAKEVRHEKYNSKTHEYDVALLQLEKPLIFSHRISPVCLPEDDTDGSYYENRMAIASGWGLINDNPREVKAELQKTTMWTLSYEECTVEGMHKWAKDAIQPSMICANGNATAICQGDSGGPLVVEESGRFTVVGIPSFTVRGDCLFAPQVFARVTNLLPWIKCNMKGTLYGRPTEEL